MRLLVASCGIAAALLCAAATGNAGGLAATTALRADVAEWSIVPSAGVVPAGRVRIVVRNLGTTRHQLVVARTGSFGERLRLSGARADVRPLAAPLTVEAGATASFVVRLKPGSYVLLDNLPWHYWKGTSAAFSVR